MEDLIRSFGLNASILLSLTLVFFLLAENRFRRSEATVKNPGPSPDIVYGLILAAIGILVMATPVDFGNGVVFDTRTILIGLAAVFFGWLPATIAAVACAGFRFYQGGTGMVPGILTILLALLIGLLWRHWRGKDLQKTRFREFYGIGVLIHLLSIVLLLSLLPGHRTVLLKQIAPVFILFYPFVFTAIALLMQHRKRFETDWLELKKSRERYRNLFLNNHLPMFLIDPQSGSLVDTNPAAESFYGWSREELLRMRITDLNTLDAAEVAQLMDQTQQGAINEFQFQHRLRDGSIREVLVRSGPVEIDGQQLLYSIMADQTESNRLLAALKESEARAREFVSAVERCHVSIVFTDAEGHIEYVNPYFCELTGYSAAEVIGQNPNLLSAGVQSKHFYRELWQTIQAGKVWEGEFCNRRKNGAPYWEYSVIAPIKNADGQIEKFVGVKHNITAHKEHEQAMKRALREAQAGDEAKAAFLSVISHELRTPLNHIVGPCEMVAEEMSDRETKQLLETAIQAGHHLTELVDRIIRYSELGGQTTNELRWIEDAKIWLEMALQRHHERAKMKGFSLKYSVSEDCLETFTADETAVTEILDAFINNALEHSSPGTIRVELSSAPPNARLAVVDPGPVISEQSKKHLFQPFQQLDMSRTRSHAGIGLGLCLCRRYAERCGGSIEVKTDRDRGNRFEFIFPIATKDEYLFK